MDAVVVLSYFGRRDTERCVESLVSGSQQAKPIVVDNGSFDGVLEAVTSRWPDVVTVQVSENQGYSGGMNVGIKKAVDMGADTITVLNNDTVVPPGAIGALTEVARSGHIAVSPEVRYADGSERVWFGGGAIDRDTLLARHLSEEELAGVESDARGLRPTATLAGCCITASRQVWERVGLFDERYFLNFEDSDWSVRASEQGIVLAVATETVIYHAVSASFTGAYAYLGLYYYARNGLLFVRGRCKGSLGQAARFVRQHVAPDMTTRLRRREWREGCRRLLVASVALADHLFGRYGRAPSWVERLAGRWTGPGVSARWESS